MAVAAYESDDAISIADVDCLSSQDRAGVQCSRHRGLENLPEGNIKSFSYCFFNRLHNHKSMPRSTWRQALVPGEAVG